MSALKFGFIGFGEVAAKRITWTVGYGLKEKFGDQAPDSFREVLDAIREVQEKA